jgi:hypothetical protein
MPEKETFGDLDLMYKYKDNINIRNIVNELFSPIEIVSNGDILSFSYKINEIDYFQIDLIKVMNIDMAQFYYGYSDCGLIIGNMLKKNNLIFGQNGLWIIYENYKIILSDNPQEICNFIQLDYDKWKNGFENKKEVFNWIIKCKYFNKETNMTTFGGSGQEPTNNFSPGQNSEELLLKYKKILNIVNYNDEELKNEIKILRDCKINKLIEITKNYINEKEAIAIILFFNIEKTLFLKKEHRIIYLFEKSEEDTLLALQVINKFANEKNICVEDSKIIFNEYIQKFIKV